MVDVRIHTTIIMERRRVREQVNTSAKSFIEYNVLRSYRLAVEHILSDGEVNCDVCMYVCLFSRLGVNIVHIDKYKVQISPVGCNQ